MNVLNISTISWNISQFSIWIIYIIILNIFKSAQCELLFLKSLCLCKFIAFSG